MKVFDELTLKNRIACTKGWIAGGWGSWEDSLKTVPLIHYWQVKKAVKGLSKEDCMKWLRDL